jgi:hypothetical protein
MLSKKSLLMPFDELVQSYRTTMLKIFQQTLAIGRQNVEMSRQFMPEEVEKPPHVLHDYGNSLGPREEELKKLKDEDPYERKIEKRGRKRKIIIPKNPPEAFESCVTGRLSEMFLSEDGTLLPIPKHTHPSEPRQNSHTHRKQFNEQRQAMPSRPQEFITSKRNDAYHVAHRFSRPREPFETPLPPNFAEVHLKEKFSLWGDDEDDSYEDKTLPPLPPREEVPPKDDAFGYLLNVDETGEHDDEAPRRAQERVKLQWPPPPPPPKSAAEEQGWEKVPAKLAPVKRSPTRKWDAIRHARRTSPPSNTHGTP